MTPVLTRLLRLVMRTLSPGLPLAFVCSLIACGGSSDQGGRILVLGLDGLDPQTVDLLMAEGKMPNFSKLRQEGAYGRLVSEKPLLSPIVWTTIATGKRPDQHGIGHFVAVNPQTGAQLPVTSQMRKVKAIWNIASDAGKEVAVVGWWATWPAEPVRGVVVSDHTAYHFLFEDAFTGGSDPGGAAGKVHPPERQAEITSLVRRPGDLKPEEVEPFIDVPLEDFSRPFSFNDDVGHFKWALATAQSYRDIGLKLWREEKPDLALVYIEGTDSTSHLFGHLFRAQGLAGELGVQQQRYGRAVEEMYQFADRTVGDFIAAMDERTTLVVLSDHGFELGALHDDPSKTRDLRRVTEHYHRPEGILYLYGHGIRRRSHLDQPSIVDVAPTLLALAGVAPAGDMPGKVLEGVINRRLPAERVASYEGTGSGPSTAIAQQDPAADAALLEQLKSLGYLQTESPKGDRNLAAVHFQAGRFPEAAEIYQRLAQQEPEDAALHASLAGVLGAMGRYAEAKRALLKSLALQPLNPEAHHNLGVIAEREANAAEAVEHYRRALRYSPGYEPSRQALLRLTGAVDANPPRSEAERRAFALAEQASQAARRGAYPDALRMLDEAASVAPNYPIVYQYRSNVAYLMGDRDGAIRALERALALEPDNALYAENLKRLRQQPPPA